MDQTVNPLGYWVGRGHPTDRYVLVLGKSKDSRFLLSPRLGGCALTFGSLEPGELSLSEDLRFNNREPSAFVGEFKYSFTQLPTGNSGRIKFKMIGSNIGIQSLSFSDSGAVKQLLKRGPMALGFTYLLQDLSVLRSFSDINTPVVTSHAGGQVVVLEDL